MRQMDKLTDDVLRGLKAHQIIANNACSSCPYYGRVNCSLRLSEDAVKVVKYWRDRYEGTVLNTPPVILNVAPEPSIVKIEQVDIKNAEKYTKAMAKAGNAAKFATEALRETTQALRELKEELDNEPPEIPEAVTAKWNISGSCTSFTLTCTNCGHRYVMSASANKDTIIPDVCGNCKAVMIGVE